MTQRAAVLLLALLASANADTLTLRNGGTVTGTWLGVAAGQIKFQVNDQIQTYPRSDVSTVNFGDFAPPQPLQPIASSPSRPSDTGPAPSVGGNVQEPDSIGVVYFKDPTGNLIPLERTQGTWRRRANALLAVTVYWEVNGAKSPFRVKSDQPMLFVVSSANGIDQAKFSLYPLEVRKDTRRTLDGSRSKNYALQKVPLDVTRVGESYGLRPATGVSTGEYCFSVSALPLGGANTNDAFCFGVDPTSVTAVPVSGTPIAPPSSNDERPILTRKSLPPPSDTAPPPLSNDVQEPTVVEVEGASQPVIIQKVAPEYTEKARDAKLTGTVTLAFIVGTDGRARDIHVVTGLGMGLDESAVKSVKKWQFRPGMKDGRPVNVRANVQVNFLVVSASTGTASVEEPRVGLPDPSNEEPPTLARGAAPAAHPPPQPAAPHPTIELLGQTKEQIVSIMGQPEKIASAGAKQIYFYKDLKITLTDGKVTDIQ